MAATLANQCWDLAELNPWERRLRAIRLRAVYAACDPRGWDARRAGLDARTAPNALRLALAGAAEAA